MSDHPLRLGVTCPQCGRPPAVRTKPSAIAREKPDDEVVMTVQCHWCMRRHRRIVIIEIRAGDIRGVA